MNAIVISAPGPASNLVLQQCPTPVPKRHEVLIEVRAAGINRPDVFQRKGNYPAPQGVVQDIPGLEVAGTVVACGSEAHRWQPGDRICALLAGGGYAEYVTADASHCLPVPDGMDFREAACLPETVFTVWHNLFQLGKLQRGETVLIHGGSGGIGTTAIQLARHFGAQVYTTAGSPGKCEFCVELGATKAINYKEEDFGELLPARSVDVILDSIGGPYFERNMALLADDGRLVFINAMEGRQAALDVLAIMQRRLTLTGSTLRSRASDFKSALRESVEQQVWPLVEAGRLRPLIHEAFPLTQASLAHERMESGEFIGKLVLDI
ncbi:NAD(P)H-quinone oxidoreductase [Parapedobacter soli]|uniref:NAD(P)H-quinone oxidoreductase n=1 Tax=Parapedobacter soli TaxID=416955 RepID=UPI0021C575A8|nr:NAD(P)H-quinone oxidoreductase [Parapedobacter soli]